MRGKLILDNLVPCPVDRRESDDFEFTPRIKYVLDELEKVETIGDGFRTEQLFRRKDTIKSICDFVNTAFFEALASGEQYDLDKINDSLKHIILMRLYKRGKRILPHFRYAYRALEHFKDTDTIILLTEQFQVRDIRAALLSAISAQEINSPMALLYTSKIFNELLLGEIRLAS